MCGEHQFLSRRHLQSAGSSPRVRETLFQGCCNLARVRFIPACAGNTCHSSSATVPPTVHPRVCGEHCVVDFRAVKVPGSSPRVRGTPVDSGPSQGRGRFIPACAGNTPRMSACNRSCAVHPRVCGEHPLIPYSGPGLTGSSPRVRGTRPPLAHRIEHRRFIPACAGNTPQPQARCGICPVHPRVCGEHQT